MVVQLQIERVATSIAGSESITHRNWTTGWQTNSRSDIIRSRLFKSFVQQWNNRWKSSKFVSKFVLNFKLKWESYFNYHFRPKKPPFTYTELIEYALEDKGELTVSGIYNWISWVLNSHFLHLSFRYFSK